MQPCRLYPPTPASLSRSPNLSPAYLRHHLIIFILSVISIISMISVISHYLYLDVVAILDVLLDEHATVTKAADGFRRGPFEAALHPPRRLGANSNSTASIGQEIPPRLRLFPQITRILRSISEHCAHKDQVSFFSVVLKCCVRHHGTAPWGLYLNGRSGDSEMPRLPRWGKRTSVRTKTTGTPVTTQYISEYKRVFASRASVWTKSLHRRRYWSKYSSDGTVVHHEGDHGESESRCCASKSIWIIWLLPSATPQAGAARH